MTRGSIGIRFTAGDTEQGRSLLKSYHTSEGAFVQEVRPGGPADKAGIKAEDVIVAIEGKPVRTSGDLVNTVTSTPVGNPLNVTVMRDGKRENYKVVVGDLAQIFPDEFGSGSKEEPGKVEGATARFGMTIQSLTAAQRQNLGVKESGGVQIASIEPDSFAEDIDLRPKDIVLSINRQAVNSVDDVRRIQNTLKPGDAVAFRILRQAGHEWASQFVAGTLPAGQ